MFQVVTPPAIFLLAIAYANPSVTHKPEGAKQIPALQKKLQFEKRSQPHYNSTKEKRFFDQMEQRLQKWAQRKSAPDAIKNVLLFKPVVRRRVSRSIHKRRLLHSELDHRMGPLCEEEPGSKSLDVQTKKPGTPSVLIFHDDPIGSPQWNAMKRLGEPLNGQIPELLNDFPGRFSLPIIEPMLYDKRKLIDLDIHRSLS